MGTYDNFLHVVPLDDLYDHFLDEECHCQPTIDEEELLIVHNSFDGREAFEEGRRKPS